MRQLSRRNVNLYFMFLKRPPTRAARWMTWVGWYLSKMAVVSARDLEGEELGREVLFVALLCPTHLKSPSLELRKIHSSPAVAFPYLLPTASFSITNLRALPTRPVGGRAR